MESGVLALVHEYDEILAGRKKIFSSIGTARNSEQRERIIVGFLRVFFRDYLKWSPSAVYTNLTYDILVKFKLAQLLPYMKFPKEISPKKDMYYLVGLVYPAYKMTPRERCIKIYSEILDGKLVKYPKGFFTGAIGEENAKTCLRYAISEQLQFSSVRDIYEYFATKGMAFIKQQQLYSAYAEDWRDPLDYLHDSLSPAQRNKQFLRYYKGRKAAGRQYQNLTLSSADENNAASAQSSKVLQFFGNALTLEGETREEALAYLFERDEWRAFAKVCFVYLISQNDFMADMDVLDLMDYMISEEGASFLVENGLRIPLDKYGNPILLLESILNEGEKKEYKEELSYAKRKYIKDHSPDKD